MLLTAKNIDKLFNAEDGNISTAVESRKILRSINQILKNGTISDEQIFPILFDKKKNDQQKISDINDFIVRNNGAKKVDLLYFVDPETPRLYNWFSVLISAFIWIASLLAYYFYHWRTFKDDVQSGMEKVQLGMENFYNVIPEDFEKKIIETIKSNQGFAQAMFKRYPSDYIDRIKKWGDTKKWADLVSFETSGGFIGCIEVDIGDYAQLLTEILNNSHESIYATSFSSHFLDTLKLYNPTLADEEDKGDEDNTKEKETWEHVKDWLDKVNQKAFDNKKTYQVRRVQLISQNDNSWEEKTDDKSYVDAIETYKILYYNPGSDNIKSIVIKKAPGKPKTHARTGPKFFGEYVIFDERILVKYSFEFEYLEIYFGSIIESYIDGFKQVFDATEPNTGISDYWEQLYNSFQIKKADEKDEKPQEDDC